MPGPGRVTKRRAETRARLLDAAFAVVARQGFGQTRIEHVTEAAGYTRGAFYSNFASLDELFLALYEQRAEQASQQVHAVLRTTGDTVAELVERVIGALLVDRDWLLVRTDFQLHAARTPEVARALREQRRRLQDSLVGPLGRVLGPDTLGGPDRVAHAVLTVFDGATAELLLDPDVPAVRRWLTELLTALLAGDREGHDDGGINGRG